MQSYTNAGAPSAPAASPAVGIYYTVESLHRTIRNTFEDGKRPLSWIDEQGVWHYESDPLPLVSKVVTDALARTNQNANQAAPLINDWMVRHSGYIFQADMTPEANRQLFERRRARTAAANIVDAWITEIAGPPPEKGYPDASPYYELAQSAYFGPGWQLHAKDLALAQPLFGRDLTADELNLLMECVVNVVADYCEG